LKDDSTSTNSSSSVTTRPEKYRTIA
jgi:hypothetical protein